MQISRRKINAVVYCCVFALFAGLISSDFFKKLEINAYDAHMRNSELLTHPDIVMVVIDDESIEKIGTWPILRDLNAHVIDYINTGNPKIIASTDLMAQEQRDMGANYLDELRNKIDSFDKGPELDNLKKEISNALNVINTDLVLANSIKSTKNYLAPIGLLPTQNIIQDEQFTENLRLKTSLHNLTGLNYNKTSQLYKFRQANTILQPSIKTYGHINKQLDQDEIIRIERFLWGVGDTVIPSLAFRIYSNSLKILSSEPDLSPKDIKLKNNKLTINEQTLNLPVSGKINTRFYSDARHELFKEYSFYDVFTESIPSKAFSNKIVLIGNTAAGIGTRYKVSSGQNLSAVEYLAHVSSSLLNNDWIKRGNKQRAIEVAIYLIIALYLIFIIPRRKILSNVLISGFIALCLLVFQFGSLEFSYWYKLITPVIFLLLGLMTLSFANLRSKEFIQDKLQKEHDETNLQLGLAFYKQGALDLAFEKFVRCGASEKLNPPLYNLGLEYERKRQYAKASSVYEYLQKISPNHLDVEQRIQESKNLAHNSTQQMFGNESKLTSLLFGNEKMENPRLGRYEIEREIGRGAMSIVYAGRDPSINRTVAIKVQSFVGDNQEMLLKMRERFMTEAKTAGQLNHPDIITIFDIGEETDLIYIAMEFLSGESLEQILSNSTLTDEEILNISYRLAKALAYAHAHKVIHRDIKPSNIIYNQKSKEMHLTDFGIARMQDAHLTQTGQVVGTPSYMSPEQITGKRVDHRSDLFSLGTTLYQLFSGNLPFQADTMATLLYKITMEAPVPLDSIRPDLPPELTRIISQLLKKEAEQRYQSAEALAKDLEDCKNAMKNTP